MILRLYGSIKVIHKYDSEWSEFSNFFADLPGARQIFKFHIDMVQTSCGMSVPLFEYINDRDSLIK